MADYQKESWADGAAGGTPLSADRLNHMEAGIDDAIQDTELDAAVAAKVTGGSATAVALAEADRDVIALALVAGQDVAITSDDAANTITIAVASTSTGHTLITAPDAATARTSLQVAQKGVRAWTGSSWTSRPSGLAAGFVTSYSDGSNGSVRDPAATDPGGFDGDEWFGVTA